MRIFIFLLACALAFVSSGQTINCDTCAAHCGHLKKKVCKKTVQGPAKPGNVNICIDNSHSGNCGHSFEPCHIKPVCVKERQCPAPTSPPSSSTPIWIGIAALFVSLVTSLYGNRISQKNTERQLEVSQQNLTKQIEASASQEGDKRDYEYTYRLRMELRDACAKFLNSATDLNHKLTRIVYGDIEEGREAEAAENYANTADIRADLKCYYYSLKVMLDGSKEQRNMEDELDKYMDVTCFQPNLKTMKSDDFNQPLGRLFHLVKSIIHSNYRAPDE